MMRSFLSEAAQKKYFLMFFACLMYIVGLIGYFSSQALLFAFLLTLLSIFVIYKNYLSPKLVLFFMFMFFFAFFNASLRIKNTDYLYQIAPIQGKISGRIISIPVMTDSSKLRFIFEVRSIEKGGIFIPIRSKTLVYLDSKKNQKIKLNIGDNYLIDAKIRIPFEVSNPSQFDYGAYLRNFGVFSVSYAEIGDCIRSEADLSFKWRFLKGLNNIRNDIIDSHSKFLKSPNLEILGGVVFGDDAISPPTDVKNSFKNSGLLHILAASGMNVAIIYGIWFFILNKLRVPYNYTLMSGIFVVLFYALMTGLGPSVVRAAIMLVFVLVGKLLDRDAHSVSLLSFVALLMLIYNPTYINDVSFQLSFVVTFGLLICVPPIMQKIKFLPQWLSGAIFIPLIAQIWVAPIQMYYFNSFSLYSVFANIAILPFVTVVSFGGFISSVLALIKPLAPFVCFLFDLILQPVLTSLVWISDFFSALPNSLLQMPKPTLMQIFLYYFIVGVLLLAIKTEKLEIRKKSLTVAFLACVLFCFSCVRFGNNKFEVIFFDVQNADCFLLKSPNGKYFIIDSAKMPYKGGKSQANAIVLEYLKDNGIKNIEALIITHFDSDHAGGAVDLLENLQIKNVYVNSLNHTSKIAKKIYNYKNVSRLKNSEIFYIEGSFQIKNYQANSKNDDNENSLITVVSDGEFDVLFMGDAGIEAFSQIQWGLPSKIEVLKVGHHGAKDVVDKKMLSRLQPNYAIISTGLNNYGHPNEVTLDLLENCGAEIYRTDRQNAIKLEELNGQSEFYRFDKGYGFVNID